MTRKTNLGRDREEAVRLATALKGTGCNANGSHS